MRSAKAVIDCLDSNQAVGTWVGILRKRVCQQVRIEMNN
jgi:hypothetical protein